MKIVLNRDDIEEAVEAYIKDKYLPYNDTRELNIVQGSKASAVVTFVQENKLPGLDEKVEKIKTEDIGEDMPQTTAPTVEQEDEPEEDSPFVPEPKHEAPPESRKIPIFPSAK